MQVTPRFVKGLKYTLHLCLDLNFVIEPLLFSVQSVQPLMRDNPILNFLDAESSINEAELFEPTDLVMQEELAAGDR